MASITFKLPSDLRTKLEEAAKEDGRTVSDFIRHFFNKKLPDVAPSKMSSSKRRARQSR